MQLHRFQHAPGSPVNLLQFVPLHVPEGTTSDGQLRKAIVALAAALNRTHVQPG